MSAKKLLKLPVVRGTLSLLVSLLLRFIFLSSRVRSITPDASRAFMSGQKQAIFCFWHGNMIMHPFHKPRGRKMAVLISHHRDGAFITAILGWLGIGTVRGSTRKGGANAMRELFTICEQGSNISITPDGPRGPVYQAAGGAAMLARKTGLPLIPVAFGATRGRRFSSWDKFLLPYPFTRILFVASEPIFAHEASDDDAVSLALRDGLMAAMQQAETQVRA